MLDSNKLDRWRGVLWGMFVGDALAMPVHWYYDVAALQRDFGVVRDFQPPSTAEARHASAYDQDICINHVAVSQLSPLSKHRVRHDE